LYRQPIGPQIIGGVLDSGFNLFRECLSKVFVLAVVASLITLPVNLLAPVFMENPPTLGIIPVVVCGLIVMGILVTAFNGAIIARIDSIARGAPLSMRDSLSIGFRRLPATILSGLVFSFGAGLLMIPGLILISLFLPSIAQAGTGVVWRLLASLIVLLGPVSAYAVWFVFAPSAVIVDRLGPIRSLSYSRTIVHGRWWRTAALLTMLGIVFIALYVLVGMVAGIVFALGASVSVAGQLPWYFQLILGPFVSAIAVPLMYSLLLSIYYDLKTRYEGGDLAARIAATA
jgi:hypothetical protein